MRGMAILSEVEKLLKDRYGGEVRSTPFTSDVPEMRPVQGDRTDALFRPEAERSKMPLTKDKYIVRENADLVAWEREARKFLRNLSPSSGHRVSASMIFEWVTGLPVRDLVEMGGSTADLKRINTILKYYFGKPKTAYICGRKVTNAYTVPPGYYIRRHRPRSMTLYAEYLEGTLYP